MIYQSSTSALLLLACAVAAAFLAIEAAPYQGQLVQLHPISRAQYETLLGLPFDDKPAAMLPRHINYTSLNPLNGWSNDISHGWRYLLNKTGLYQKPMKPTTVQNRGYKLCYVNPIYGGPNAGEEPPKGRAARGAIEAEKLAAIDEEEEDDAVDENGKPIAVQYFPHPSVTCVWVKPEPEKEEEGEEEEGEGGEETGSGAGPQAAAGVYPYAGVDPYASAYTNYPYAAYPYDAAALYASPYAIPNVTPYAYGRSEAKSSKKTTPTLALNDMMSQHAVNMVDKSMDQRTKQQKQQPLKQQPLKQQSRQYGSYGYGSPYGGSYGSPYGGYYGGIYGSPYGGAYGGAYGNGYGSPYVGLNPYAGIYGGQSFAYPGYGYDNEDSGEDGEDTGDSEDSGETGETYDHEGHDSGEYGGEEEDDE